MSRDSAGKPQWVFGALKGSTTRKREEAAPRKSGAFLKHTEWLAKVGGWELEIATGVLTWTAETRRIHGVPPDYKPNVDTAINFFAPEARAAIRVVVESTLAGSGPWDLELPLIRADGTSIWARTVGSVVLANGKPVQLAGAFQDVTARVAEGHALRKANEGVTSATDSGRIGIWDWDVVAGTMYWDERMCQIYGIARPSGRGAYRTWRRRLHPDDLAAAEQAMQDAIQGIRDYDITFRIVGGHGSVRMIRAMGRVIRDPAGQALRMLGSSWEVRETHRLTAELALQHEMLRVTLRAIGDGLITTDGDGLIVWLNPVAERLTGWLAAEAVGQKFDEVFRIVNKATRLPAENPAALCLARGKAGGLARDAVLISRHGQEFGIEDSAAPTLSAEGETLGAVLVFHCKHPVFPM